jgi:uncharacterized membrane protein YfhO
MLSLNDSQRGKNLGKVFLLCFINACLLLLPYIIEGQGRLVIIDDFNAQQIPFNIMCNDAIKSGSGFWSWYTDLGSSFVGAFSFYTLGSPFFWLSMLFPPTAFPYVVGPLLILKYAVAGTTAYLYAQRYFKNKNYAVLAALLYAFSGFQTINLMFNHFHNVVALFPLLLWALDSLVEDGKKGRFAWTVALMALTNFFFFVGEVVFVLLYFCIRYLAVNFRKYIRKLPLCLMEGVLGVGISAVLLLPSLLFTLQNPRTDSSLYGESAFAFSGSNYLKIIKGVLFPADLQPTYTVLFDTDRNNSYHF